MSTSCPRRLSQPWAEMLQDARLDRRPGTLDSIQNLRTALEVPSPLWIPVSLTVIGWHMSCCLSAISWVRMQRPGLTELTRDRVDPGSRELKALSCKSWASKVGEGEKARMNPR